ncbi:hypothetical protein TNCV_1274801 [Trichonephila clavipes]|nr:hypothetical protein TNCV_1274801 [Trichonephila clavipes]
MQALSGINVSEKVGKVPKTTNNRRLLAQLKTSKKCLRWYDLTKDLNLHGVCQHIVPRKLNEDQSAEEVKSASQAELKDMAKNRFHICFHGLYKSWK